MDALSVFQEQSMLLYVNAALLIVLIIIGIGLFVRLGEVRDALSNNPQRSSQAQMSNVKAQPTGT